MKNFIIIVIFVLFNACSGIKFLSKGSNQEIYNKEFLASIEKSKEYFRAGDIGKALKVLNELDDTSLVPAEIALKNNLIGVIYFGQKKFPEALDSFQKALTIGSQDQSLTSQIYLNLAGVHYKLNEFEKAYTSLLSIKYEVLAPVESNKANKLLYTVAKHLGNDQHATQALLRMLSSHTALDSLQSDENYQVLISTYFKVGSSDRMTLLSPFYQYKPLIVGHLMLLDAQKRFYDGDKSSARDILNDIVKNFEGHEELVREASNFQFRIDNYSRMELHKIGVIVPLSGNKKEYGQRLLNGIDFSLFSNKENEFRPTVVVKDSKGSGAVGRMMVRELVERHAVSAIIGGLLPGEAEKEYLESRKYGVLYISLSTIHLPREMKDHLLIEVQGSIESQINTLLQPAILEQLGKRGAILYPKDDQGIIYLNEFWNRTQERKISIVDAMSYKPQSADYRQPIENLLGLRDFRIRKEEFDLLTEIYSLEKNTSVRRIQTLKPQVDFDWIFIPNNSREALQLIPTFSYFDAFKLKFIGTPSWRSASLAKESSRLGNLFFVGDDLVLLEDNLAKAFEKRFGDDPKIVEIRGMDAMRLVSQIASKSGITSRDDLDIYIKSKNILKGISGKWILQDNIWIKELTMLKLKKDDIEVVAPNRKSID